jgi:uncharacterized Fe-S cluster-containing radical SAM superfamily protein
MAKSGCGNIHHRSIAEIWNGPEFREFRRKMAEGHSQEICRPECPRLHGEIREPGIHPLNLAFARNYVRSQEEIARRAIVLESWPRFFKVTHSTLCNLDCVMCYQDRDDTRTLPDEFYQQLAELHDCVQEIQVLGGEPFAIRRVREFLRCFSRERFPDSRFSLVTNGTVHDGGTLELVRNLAVSWMTVSLDAATPETYARIRRKGDFADALEGTRKWIALGREQGFVVTIAFTVMHDNVHEIASFARMAGGLGIDCLYGTVMGDKGGQRVIDKGLLLTSLAAGRAEVASTGFPMPLAELTLSSIRPESYSPEPLVAIAV